ncbi:helix-turn-helix domain-containing protein [Vibrio sp. Vb2110]|uniref:helix-turn-helix domain-containing protein n=1 Tax=Vibrio TaxID=662 RepID=UPI00235E6518|nr:MULTISPECIES: helix-turn-helix domain-containing protein [Vibrio]EJE8515988.1 hypothetical protein [Vibrio parahaemolyticus]EJE8774784.1 hypothetical protein [Vibrio parahaemolyticus]ELA9194695.1 hypothetical protein [Vibrio parahaemolyticus]MDF4745294.1 helix-turn-helix domain-containing protein [Vibrio parahaemolyticus]MDG3412932.1 helix-turn-helix domain-containing protein [Vibrio parahaemolyticus]
MTTVITYDEVLQCVKREIELTDITDEMKLTPDLSNLMPEVRFAIVETLLLHTHGNQAKAARMLGINRGTLSKIYEQRLS